MRPGSVCRHLKIAGRAIISRFFHVTSQQPRKLQHIRTNALGRPAPFVKIAVVVDFRAYVWRKVVGTQGESSFCRYPVTIPPSEFAKETRPLWLCPNCGGPMVVIERLTAAQIQLRSPPFLSGAAA